MKNLSLLLLLLIVASCARLGTPSGGPKDKTPPKFLGSSPDTLAKNVDINTKQVVLNFDEYVILKDYSKNIVISPPFEINPQFSPTGLAKKSVKITFQEPLKPNTTYNINFGESLQDNNEGNKLSDFKYVFSTGDYLDSLKLTGGVSQVKSRDVPKEVVVGLYKMDSSYTDSTIYKKKPYYVSRLDSAKQFHLDYLHPGKYRLIAFEDKVTNMQFDLGQEKLAFYPNPITLDSLPKIDLQLFAQSAFYRALKAEQKGYGHIVLKVQGAPSQLKITPIQEFNSAKIYFTPKTDSADFWFNPKIDSISEKTSKYRFLVDNGSKTDTLTVMYKKTERPKLLLKELSSGKYSSSTVFQLKSEIPIMSIDSSLISVKKDSIDQAFKIKFDPKQPYQFSVAFPMALDQNYTVFVPKSALRNIQEIENDSIVYKFKTGSRADFGNLKLSISNLPKHKFWLQLTDEKGSVLQEKYVENQQSVFEFNALLPKKYSFMLLVDENDNGLWDNGDFFQNKQPEKVVFYPDLVEVRPMWSIEETWILNSE